MIKIEGVGKYLGNSCYTNDMMKTFVDTSDEWISSRTGIKQRYFSFNENTSFLAFQAAKEAIEMAKIQPNDLSIIIVATMTPDKITPNTASHVQKYLKINRKQIMVFDLNVACTGFIYALDIASKLLKPEQKALVIGAETLSKIMDFNDRNTCCLFGDGAGAVVISASKEQKYGSYFNNLNDEDEVLFANGLALNGQEQIKNVLQMQGQAVFRFATKACSHSITEVLKQSALDIEDIDLIIPHQANYRIIKSISRDLKVDLNRFFINLANYGNTSAASVAIALAEAYTTNKIKNNDKIVLVAFGAGLSMGAIVLNVAR